MTCFTTMSSVSINSVFMKTTHNRYRSDTPFSNADSMAVQITGSNTQKIQEVWSKHNFETTTTTNGQIIDTLKMTWAENEPIHNGDGDGVDEKIVTDQAPSKGEKIEVTSPSQHNNGQEKDGEVSPSHHARRPMNAFLIFCKKHRPIVRQKFTTLENRGVTRILGEWWAQLDVEDKKPYTDLAREYKDAFLSANPDFRWYKLPAPPLRTLTVRPTTITSTKQPSPVSSPTHNFTSESEFTPGKLADESQLGSLTSLMINNFNSCKSNNNNNNHNNNNVIGDDNDDGGYVQLSISPVNLMTSAAVPPPKPIKKRIVVVEDCQEKDHHKNVSRNLMLDCDERNDITNQDILDKVVDKIFTSKSDEREASRKSGRQCKGKRYEKFMFEGRLLGNKRDTKLTSQRFSSEDNDFKLETNHKSSETETPNLDHTIKRLAERTKMRNFLDTVTKSEDTNNTSTNNNINNNNNNDNNNRVRNISESSEGGGGRQTSSDFNLDLRIKNLSSLSYEVFSQRKKDSKKRKNRIKTDERKSKMAKINVEQPVGSKKRKNKQSITHLEKKDDDDGICSELLGGLATLAEVAANTQKINEDDNDNASMMLPFA